MRNKHQSYCKSGNHIVDQPSVVVSWEPADDGEFVDCMVNRRCWYGSRSLGSELGRPVPGVVISLLIDKLAEELHHDEKNLLNDQDRRLSVIQT